MTREEAIECNKNLRMYMKLSDKNQPCKFLEDNYIALDMAIKALELVEYIEQRYEEECKERREHYADGRYHGLSMSDGASYVLGQVLDKWRGECEG